jgi:arylsulfatase A-like enzyme
MLTGLLPAEHGADHPRGAAQGLKPGVVRAAAPLLDGLPTLAELLRARGYRTGAVVANSAYLDYRFGLDRGFEHYDDRPGSYVGEYRALVQMLGFDRRAGQLIYRDARQISEAALEWLAGGSEPFFLLLNFMDAHSPCLPPPAFQRVFEGQALPADIPPGQAARLDLYDGSLRYIDREVLRVVDGLRERGWFEGTALIVTSDHGEAFGEHHFWDHAWTLYDELLRVPLYVKPAGVRTHAVEPRPTSLREVFGIALELTRTPAPSAPRHDVPLAEWYCSTTNPGIRRWAERVGRDLESDLVSWVEAGVKYIVASGGDVEAYDLGLDPGERHPLELSPERQAEALAKARAWWAAHPPLTQGAAELDAQTQARMQALGYAGEE